MVKHMEPITNLETPGFTLTPVPLLMLHWLVSGFNKMRFFRVVWVLPEGCLIIG